MVGTEKQEKRVKEPSVIVKPLGWLGGLDGIHLSLMVLVVILIALLLAVSASGRQLGSGQLNCTYGSVNGTCIAPLHNQSQVLLAAGRFIAGYTSVNSSLSLLPYISDMANASVSYGLESGAWNVKVPEKNPYSQTTFYLQLSVNDTNLSVLPFIQSASPSGSDGQLRFSLRDGEARGQERVLGHQPDPGVLVHRPLRLGQHRQPCKPSKPGKRPGQQDRAASGDTLHPGLAGDGGHLRAQQHASSSASTSSAPPSSPTSASSRGR